MKYNNDVDKHTSKEGIKKVEIAWTAAIVIMNFGILSSAFPEKNIVIKIGNRK